MSAEDRVALLEGIIREARRMALDGEWDEPMIAKALGTVFACDECMDTGIVGGMPQGDERDSLCGVCRREPADLLNQPNPLLQLARREGYKPKHRIDPPRYVDTDKEWP